MKEYLRRRLYIKKTQVGKNAAREASCKRAYRLHATALHRTLCAWDRIPVLHHMHPPLRSIVPNNLSLSLFYLPSLSLYVCSAQT